MEFKNPAAVRGAATVIVVCLVAAGIISWVLAAGVPGNSAGASAAPAAAFSPVASTITLVGGNPPQSFAPPPEDATPAMTPQQAADAYVVALGHAPVAIPSDVSVYLGSLTIPVGPDCGADCENGNTVSNGIAYSALNELAYGYEVSTCPQGSSLPEDQCTKWMFLDADTGNLIIEIDPALPTGPDPSPSPSQSATG